MPQVQELKSDWLDSMLTLLQWLCDLAQVTVLLWTAVTASMLKWGSCKSLQHRVNMSKVTKTLSGSAIILLNLGLSGSV